MQSLFKLCANLNSEYVLMILSDFVRVRSFRKGEGMLKLFGMGSSKRKNLEFIKKSEQALNENCVLKATLIDIEQDSDTELIRYDASLVKVGKFYKLMITQKDDCKRIRFNQLDFDSWDKIDDYLLAETGFLITDFKRKKVELVKDDSELFERSELE